MSGNEVIHFPDLMKDGGVIAIIACPCDCEFVTPIGVSCNPAGAAGGRMTITSDGITWNKEVGPEGEGVFIRTLYSCREGCIFEVTQELREDGCTTMVVSNWCKSDVFVPEAIWKA